MTDKYILLIDGDNVNYSYFELFFSYIEENYGKIVETHLVGKLESSYLDDWKQIKEKVPNAIMHNVEENYKNSTDIQMAIIATKKYFYDNCKNFVILSSDADMLSISIGLPKDTKIIIGYSERKASSKYLASLDKHKITRINIDVIRGELTDKDLQHIVDKTMKTYINFKLSSKFFSYNAVQEWIADRYPGLDVITGENIYKYCSDMILHFTPDGVQVKSGGEE